MKLLTWRSATLGLLLVSFFTAVQAKAQTVNHRIVEIKRLTETPAEIQWRNGRGNVIDFNRDIPGLERVAQTKKASQYLHANQDPNEIPVTEKHNAITVEMQPETGPENVSMRGKYQVSLPADLKHIQLEIEYDLFTDEADPETLNEFYVEIEEKDSNNPNQWNKTAEIREPETIRRNDAQRVFTMGEEKFTTHSYAADLSKWAGKTVQIVLASKNNSGRQAKGRWVEARLVGSTFSISVGD